MPLEKEQKEVLRYMDGKNTGAVFFELDQKWYFKCDFRENSELAKRYMAWLEDELTNLN